MSNRESRDQIHIQSLLKCFLGREKIGDQVEVRARSQGKGRKKIATGRFSFSRDVQMLIETCRSFFLKITALFWYFFFCSISFVTSIYLLLTIKKSQQKVFLCFFWRFSRFAGMACAREAKDSPESMNDIDGSFYSEL